MKKLTAKQAGKRMFDIENKQTPSTKHDQTIATIMEELSNKDKIEALRELFLLQMKQAQQWERNECDKYTAQTKIIVVPKFTNEVITEIRVNFLEKFKSPYQFEALKRILFINGVIPQSMSEIEYYCHEIKNNLLTGNMVVPT